MAAAAALTYWRSLQIPLISDDYTVISIARSYGLPGGWETLAHDALYRCRATFMILTYWLDRWFELSPQPYHWVSIGTHVLNSLVVLSFGVWDKIGWRIALPAAIFFAVSQAHQEAVVWYSALPDQLAFLFVAAAVGALLVWLRTARGVWYATSAALFTLGLFSKESAIVAVPLMALAAAAEKSAVQRSLLALAPFGLGAFVYFLAGYAARSGHLHYNDGTFQLGLHFLPVVGRSMIRLFWPWGFVALAAILAQGWKNLPRVAFAIGWCAIAFLPYAFLTYMPFVPSRHTYIASAGVAIVIGCGYRAIESALRPKSPALALLAILVIGIDWGYLWTRKQRQYLERAEPTEVFIQKIQDFRGVVEVACFPYGLDPIVRAAEMLHGNGVSVRAAEPFRTAGTCDYDVDLKLLSE